MVSAQAPINYAELVRPGETHGSAYTSREIFEDEVRKIFHRTWMYVGHASEIPEPGDYVTRIIGRTPVLMCRDKEGEIRLFLNRCRHQANTVCQLEAGNSSIFRCAYHGWTYNSKGELTGVPLPDAYGSSFRKEDHGLTRVPHVGSYRGFVFCCLAPTTVSLDEFLGEPTKRLVDLFCDASPEGEIEVRGGALKVVYYGNWKFQGGDGYHGPYTHKRLFDLMRSRSGGPSGVGARDGGSNRSLGNGHGALDFLADVNHQLPDLPWAREYRASLERAYGRERAAFIIRSNADPHLIGFPNWHVVTGHVRIIIPVSAHETRELFQVALLKGVPPEVNALRVRQVQEGWGASGCINPDDVEMFERNMEGLQAELDPWVFLARGVHRERTDEDGTVAGPISDEVIRRAQQEHWLRLITAP